MGIDVGQVIDGKYRVTACIGEGGMGAVYAGEHLKLHRRVAIKVLHAAMAREAETVGRFEREAQAAGRIGNDHILEVFDIGEFPGGDRYIVMEFLDGEPFDKRLTRLGRLAPRQMYPVARQLLEGLGAAHAAGIVHRDLKPANVFILREKTGIPDYVKLIDFGISKFQSMVGDVSKTRTGTIIGTPSYMSPEQARGLREADARSDIYAVGVILYEAITGRVPFEGTSTNDVLFKIFLNEPPPIESVATDVDPAFGSIVMRALAKDAAARFQSAEEFIAALDAWANTGVGVAAVPVQVSALSTTMLEPPRPAHPPARTPLPAPRTPAPGPRTQGAWAASHAEAANGSRRSPSVVLGVVVAVVALVSGGSVWALLGRSAKPNTGDGPPAATAPVAVAPNAAALPSSARVEPLPTMEPPPPRDADLHVEEPASPAVLSSAAASLPVAAAPREHHPAPNGAPPGSSHAHARPAASTPAAPTESAPNFGY